MFCDFRFSFFSNIWNFFFWRFNSLLFLIICVKLQLQPKNFKYKKKQKKRSFRQFNNNYGLKFGDAGLITTRPIILTGPQLAKLKLFLRRGARKSDKTKRRIWFNLFPHLPFSKKPANVRMGKGKGKLKVWFINLKGGSTLVEYQNLRYGRIKYFFNQMSFKMGISVSKLYAHQLFFKFPMRSSKNFFFQSFWH